MAVSFKFTTFAPDNPNITDMAKTKLRIKELLTERNMTQVELAEKLGIAPLSLNQAMYRNNFSLAKLEEIADAIGCRVIDLFDNSYEVECPHCGHKIEIVLNLKGLSKEQKTED